MITNKLENAILVLRDMFSNHNFSFGKVDYYKIFKKYCNKIEESRNVSFQLYNSMNNNDYNLEVYYSKKKEKLENEIIDLENKFPWMKKEYDGLAVGTQTIRKHTNTRPQGKRWKLERVGNPIDRGIFKI